MKSFSSFYRVEVELVEIKNSVTSLLNSLERFKVFIAVLTVSIFLWNSEFFLLSSEMNKAMLPMIRPFIIELKIRIGIATMISSWVLGQTSPTPNR